MSWVAILAVAVALGCAGWVLARVRRSADARPDAVATGVATSASNDAGDTFSPEIEPALVGGSASGSSSAISAVELESERAILERLCTRAVAGAPVAPGAASDAARSAALDAAVETLAGIRAHPRYVPRRPQLLPQLTRAINDPAASAQSIAAILGQDPALAGNLLRIANSAMYRRQAAPIEQLERAVALLGTEGLRKTVMAALLQPVITDDGSVFARCAALLWDHTLLSANLAMRPVQGASRDDLHAAQLLALLYGLGSVVVVQVLRDSWGRSGGGSPDRDTLATLLETWSLRCARAISADWGLSGRVQHALEELAADTGEQDLGDLGRALRVSRALAAAEMTGTAGADPEPVTS